MKLTIEKDRERLKRFTHIKPPPPWQRSRCERRCPGSRRDCTREKDHPGPHAAHGVLGRVLAVWDEGAGSRSPAKRAPIRSVKPAVRTGSGIHSAKTSGSVGRFSAFKTWLAGLLGRIPSIEESFLLVLALAMAAFAVDWALRVLGLK